MSRKTPQSSKSPRDRLSADFLQSFAEDFAINGAAVIQALREKSPERYAELAGKVIMAAEEPDDDLSFKSCQNMQDVGATLLRTVGLQAPTKSQINAAVRLNDKFVRGLERIAGVSKADSANGKDQTNHVDEVGAMQRYLGQ